MPDDPTERGQADRIRINVNEEHELRRWSERLGVTPEKLRELVEQARPMVANLESAIRRGDRSKKDR